MAKISSDSLCMHGLVQGASLFRLDILEVEEWPAQKQT
jgi:hypothetical protein